MVEGRQQICGFGGGGGKKQKCGGGDGVVAGNRTFIIIKLSDFSLSRKRVMAFKNLNQQIFCKSNKKQDLYRH